MERGHHFVGKVNLTSVVPGNRRSSFRKSVPSTALLVPIESGHMVHLTGRQNSLA